MSDPSLQQLEREVEAARAKLTGDLSTLRSPRTYSEFRSDFKNDVIDVKDAVVNQAKSSVQSTIESFVDDLKARAAANPAAALAIGAGIAWRLIQRPPIATALVGAGLYSLFRTTPTQPTSRTTEGYLTLAKDRLGEQASDFAESVKDRAMAIGQSAADKTSEFAGSMKDRAVAMGEAVSDKAAEFAGGAADQAQHWSGEVRSSVHRVAENATSMAHRAAGSLDEMRQASTQVAERVTSRVSDELPRLFPETKSTQEARDTLLLGAAGVAVVAALGFAWQRRTNESADAN